MTRTRFAMLRPLVCILPIVCAFTAPIAQRRVIARPYHISELHSAVAPRSDAYTTDYKSTTTRQSLDKTVIRTFQHDNVTLSYRYRAASPGCEDLSPILLIHPVGVGMSSWFYKKLMNIKDAPAMYAIDLWGCGIQNGGDAWQPKEQGMHFPLTWVKNCEALIQQEIIPAHSRKGRKQGGSNIPFFGKSSQQTPVSVNVLAQGGLAPVGVVLAARNPQMVKNLILTSPPTYEDMTVKAVPEKELERNYKFLQSPVLGKLAFQFLETRGAVKFFSNAFLFANACDDEWLDEVAYDTLYEARPPVQAFNAGFCMHRSYQPEFDDLSRHDQKVVILQGQEPRKREKYAENIANCKLMTIPGTMNVLPWEDPQAVHQIIMDECY